LVAEALPASVFLDRPELGHFGPLEVPADLAETVREAFSKVSDHSPAPRHEVSDHSPAPQSDGT
ncbi:MAG: hypothetical protein GX868_11075, partial [Actinobacteria bacterium]|nr:hypothetical protein [Actinomycetota bacterium]